MPKRKREDDDFSKRKIQPTNVDATVAQSRKLLHRALKLAKGFERQKLSRRQKSAQNEQDAKQIDRINAEIEAWKRIDVGQVAHGYLSRLVTRDKELCQVAELVHKAATPPRTAGDIATTNVTARLYNANPTKQCVKQIMESLRRCAGLGGRRLKQLQVGAQTRAVNGREDAERAERQAGKDHSKMILDVDSGSFGRRSPAEQENETGEGANTTIDDSEYSGLEAKYNARIAPDSDEETSEEQPQKGRTDVTRLNDVWSGSEASVDDMEMDQSLPESGSDASEPPTASKRPTKSQPRYQLEERSAGKSAFLPALTSVGYISGSGSDSEFTDVDDTAQPKRNRRGQRARQQIWEKKFGASAKHLQQPANGRAKGRDEGWDMKRGAEGSRGERNRRGGRGGRGATGANTEAVVNRLAPHRHASTRGSSGGGRSRSQPTSSQPADRGHDDQGVLHPSWEARKVAKQAQQAAPFKGTKTTFD